jgi:hypothetical protein
MICVFGEPQYFLCRRQENFQPRTQLFFLVEKHTSVFTKAKKIEAVQSF